MNRKVLVTGASRGIGKATALTLAEDGYSLILHASQPSSLDGLVEEIPPGTNYEVMTADFSSEEETLKFASVLKKAHKDLYAIISNAGIALDKPLAYQPLADINRLIQVNLKAPILLAKAAMKIFSRSKQGVFISLSSCVGEMGNAFQAVYAATKAGNVAMCKSLCKEIGLLNENHQVRFLTVSPGVIETDMVQSLSDDIKEKYLANIPANRAGNAQEVANALSFLLSDEASYINGSDIKINGGLL